MRKELVLQLLFVTFVTSYPYFRDKIPNGHRMSHPCKPNYMWYGVGHENPQGGGNRNPFGEDFKKNGFEWNYCLCKEDSDGDGLTNGEELGDPDCNWKEGESEDSNRVITHPGICEPFDNPKCAGKNEFLDCSSDEYDECSAINQPGVKNITLRLDRTSVPSGDTTYICQTFELPFDRDYHLIASQPLIDNMDIMHHMILYGCPQSLEAEAKDLFSSPTPCSNMVPCQEQVDGWTLGSGGSCLNENVGIRLGSGGFRTVILELHWNNPEMKSTYTDSSGITLYYTDQLRPNDGGTMVITPAMVQIPPGYLDYVNYGGCTSECTNKMLGNATIYVTDIFPHMHYLGSGFSVEQIRDGKVINKMNVAQYFYDNPEVYIPDAPWEIQGGDEILVTCHFQSKTKTTFTYFGEETFNEMCIAFLTYYPNHNLLEAESTCSSTNGLGSCLNEWISNTNGECDSNEFYTVLENNRGRLMAVCDVTGITCNDRCKEVLAEVKMQACFQTDYVFALSALYGYDPEGQKLLNMLASCDLKPEVGPDSPATPVATCDIPIGGVSSVSYGSFTLIFTVAIAYCTIYNY